MGKARGPGADGGLNTCKLACKISVNVLRRTMLRKMVDEEVFNNKFRVEPCPLASLP